MVFSRSCLCFKNKTTSFTNFYLVFGGGGHTNVLMILSVALRTCSGTSSLNERSFRLINGSGIRNSDLQ